MIYDFLARAENYCEARGDEQWFRKIYFDHREHYGVVDATWKTLAYLYSDEVADEIEDQSRPCGSYSC